MNRRSLPSLVKPDDSKSLENTIRGLAIELWSNAAGKLLLVAGEADAQRLMQSDGIGRGAVYTASEMRQMITIGRQEAVQIVHEWKQRFDGVLRNALRRPRINQNSSII